MADNKPRLGNPFKTSVYKYPRKNKDGKTWYYKQPYTKMVGGKEEYNKAVKKITEAYKAFVKKNKFLPNQTDLIEATGENQYRVKLIAERKNLKLSNKRNPTLPKPDYGPNQAYLDSLNVFLDKDKEAKFIKDLRKMYSYPINSSAAKAAGVLTRDQLNKKYDTKNITKYINKYATELGLERPTQTYEGEQLTKVQANKERKKLIKEVSGPYQEGVVRRAKFKSGLDLAHRSSLLQNKKLGLKYLVSDLGLDPAFLNQEIIVPTEQKLESLYKKQNNLRNKGQKFFLDKNKKIPDTLSKSIEDINKKITDVVYSTNGRLNGIVIDEKTLKPGKVGIDYSKVLGSGLIEDKPVKDLTQADMDLIKANLGSQIENETQVAKNLTRIYESGSKKLRDSFDKRIGCKTGCFVKKLNENPQKMIRLFRGEGFKSRSGPTIKEMAKTFNVSEAEAKKKLLSGQWFTSDPVAASSYTDKLGKTKYVDVTPREFLNFKKYVDRVNKTKSLSGKDRYPVGTQDKLSIVPRYKLKEFEEANRLKSQRNLFKNFNLKTGYAERPPGVLTYDSVLGGFVDSKYPTQKVSDLQIKAWATENPMPVKAGTEDALKPIKGNLLKTVGKSLAYVGAPLPTALIDTYFIGKQIAEDRPAAEIAKDPLNWLGLATMSTLSNISGVTKPGKMNAALRLGMSPGLIRGVSRFAGIPGLAISTALTAYDQYNKYKNEEGLIYNLFNDKAKAV